MTRSDKPQIPVNPAGLSQPSLGPNLGSDQQRQSGHSLHILLVEDDLPICAVLTACLTAQHYQVTTAGDGQVGLAMAQQFPYDLIVLDIVLPGLDGIRFCQSLRSLGNQTPILLLTAKEDKPDRVLGLNAGADDYMVKPFDPEELLARIRALLRRGRAAPASEGGVLAWENLRLDGISRVVWANQQPLALTPKEYGLLELFLTSPNRVFSRSTILDRLWDLAEAPGEETVSTHIKCLRQKLRAAGITDPIQTVHGMGYRLRPAASPASDLSPASPPAADPPLLDLPLAADSGQKHQTPARQNLASRSDKDQPGQNPTGQSPQERQKVSAITARVWHQSQGQFVHQAETIVRAVQASAQGNLTPELRQQGQQAAHKLAGSLGIFGLLTGSEAAHCLENALQFQATSQGDQPSDQPDPLQIAQLQRWVQVLLQSLLYSGESVQLAPEPSGSDAVPSTGLVTEALPLVWVLLPDRHLVEQLATVALSWGLRVEAIAVEVAIQVATQIGTQTGTQVATPVAAPVAQVPQAALLDLDQLDWQTALALAGVMPTVVLTGREQLQERLAATERGGLYLQKPLLVAEIFQALTQVLRPLPTVANRVMIVDDDPTVLNWLEALLQPWSVRVFGISDVQQVWPSLRTALPNLLILDSEMPEFSGCQICQMLRQDPQWRDLPILFLSKHGDASSIDRALRAGANDYLYKAHPAVASQLLSHLQRSGFQALQNAVPPAGSPAANPPNCPPNWEAGP